MSKLKVNELDTKTGTTLTVTTGKTLDIPAGGTISVAGTQTVTGTQTVSGAQTNTGTLDISGATVTLPVTLPATAGTNITSLPAANVTGTLPANTLGNVPSQTALLNDIATLALQQATQNNQSAYNLANAFIDQYEDETGVDVKTDVAYDATGEYFSTIAPGRTGSATVISASGNAQHSTNKAKFGTSSFQTYISGSAGQLTASPTNTAFGSGSWTIEYWINANAVNAWQEVMEIYMVVHTF